MADPILGNRYGTLKIWDKHGIKQAGFWTVLIGDGNHDLHYLLAWDSLADREKKWNAFQADLAWHKARDDSENNAPLTANIKSAFLRRRHFRRYSEGNAAVAAANGPERGTGVRAGRLTRLVAAFMVTPQGCQ